MPTKKKAKKKRVARVVVPVDAIKPMFDAIPEPQISEAAAADQVEVVIPREDGSPVKLVFGATPWRRLWELLKR